MKNFETELPTGYVEAKIVDAKDGKFALWMNVVSAIVFAAVFAVVWFSLFHGETANDYAEIFDSESFRGWGLFLFALGYLGAMTVYVVLHELTHGAVYKLLTKRKLTFGVTFSAAFCGVPDIFVYRKTALCSLWAPFCVFGVAFLLPMFFVKNTVAVLFLGLLLAAHIGGCVGDLYDVGLLLVKFRDCRTLMHDTGPKQTFYVCVEKFQKH